MKQLMLFAIRVYQRVFSLDGGWLGYIIPVKVCRFTPRCSEYMYEAVSRYGIIRGFLLGIKRLFRCHPWGKGGNDQVPTLI